MATPLTHAFFALAGGKAAIHRKAPMQFWVLMAICAAVPDIDVLWRRLVANPMGIWAHRGIAHSLLAAAVFGLLAACVCRAGKQPPNIPDAAPGRRRPARTFLLLWLVFALATASHAMLDMLSTGYRGVMLLAPFDDHRYAFGWQPIWSMPQWVGQTLRRLAPHGGRGSWLAMAFLSEIIVVWAPMTVLLIVSRLVRQAHRKERATVLED
ncbi:MAG: metal-dependent hydrolase [Phycisphaerae bacterium]